MEIKTAFRETQEPVDDVTAFKAALPGARNCENIGWLRKVWPLQVPRIMIGPRPTWIPERLLIVVEFRSIIREPQSVRKLKYELGSNIR